MSAELAMIAAGAGGSVTLFFVGLVRLARMPRMLVEQRLQNLQQRVPYLVTNVEVLRGHRESRLPFLDMVLGRGAWSTDTRKVLDQAGLQLRTGEYLALRVIAIVGAGIAGALLGAMLFGAGALVAFGGAAAGVLAPGMWLRRRVAKRRRAIDSALVELSESMASMLESGFGYLQALGMAATEVPPPLSAELAQMYDAIRLGAGVDDALEELNARLASRDFDMLATAISIQRRSGGALSGILRGVAHTIRERQLFRLEVAALTSRERYSALIVASFPLLLVGILSLMAPETYTRLYSEFGGRVMLAIALSADLFGYLLIKRVTRMEA